MFFKIFTVAVFIAVIFNKIDAKAPGYSGSHYWREYNGTIPEDALVAGEDVTKGKAYVGQIIIPGSGPYSGTLREGKFDISVNYNGVVTKNNSIKILCVPHENELRWVSMNCEDQAKFHRVVSGFASEYKDEPDGGNLFLIKKDIDGQVVIGHTLGNKCVGYFALGNDLYEEKDFEMFVYH